MGAPFPEYESHDAMGLAELVRQGEITPAELLEAALERVERYNGRLNCVVTPSEDEARAQLEAGLDDGPLRGVPFLLKDLYLNQTGVRTTHGSKLFEDFVPDHDSELVARYRRAGLVLFGKSATPEFGLSTSTESTLFGATRNPWSLEHMAGGSSGGASSAVAAGILPAANASDGGGSIRIPASCCGLVGLKPTRARTPFGPDAGEGWNGMSHVHAVTRSVRDSAALLDATHGADLGAPYWAPPPPRPYLEEVGTKPGRLRVACQVETFNGSSTHPDCRAALEGAAKLLAELGHEVIPARFEIDDLEAFGQATSTIMCSNLRAALVDRAQSLGRELKEGDVEPITWIMAESVTGRSAEDLARSIRRIHAVGRAFDGFLSDYDVLLTPTMATPPLPIGLLSLSNPDLRDYGQRIVGTVGFTQLFNASGHPAMSLPLHWNDDGLPIGVQTVGRFGDEGTLFRLAAQIEEARPWFDRRPALD